MRGSECAPSRVRSRSPPSARFTVEIRAPLDELGHAQRPFSHQHLGGGPINQAVPGVHRVFKVQRNVFVALHGDGDAALRIVRVRFADRFLGDDENIAVRGQLDGGAKSRYARAHHQKIYLRALVITFEANTEGEGTGDEGQGLRESGSRRSCGESEARIKPPRSSWAKFAAADGVEGIVFLLAGFSALIVWACAAKSHTMLYSVLWALVGVMASYVWFIAYALIDRSSKPAKDSTLELATFRPMWGSTNTPFPKGAANLRRIEAKTPEKLAIVQLRGLKLLAWASGLGSRYFAAAEERPQDEEPFSKANRPATWCTFVLLRAGRVWRRKPLVSTRRAHHSFIRL